MWAAEFMPKAQIDLLSRVRGNENGIVSEPDGQPVERKKCNRLGKLGGCLCEHVAVVRVCVGLEFNEAVLRAFQEHQQFNVTEGFAVGI